MLPLKLEQGHRPNYIRAHVVFQVLGVGHGPYSGRQQPRYRHSPNASNNVRLRNQKIHVALDGAVDKRPNPYLHLIKYLDFWLLE